MKILPIISFLMFFCINIKAQDINKSSNTANLDIEKIEKENIFSKKVEEIIENLKADLSNSSLSAETENLILYKLHTLREEINSLLNNDFTICHSTQNFLEALSKVRKALALYFASTNHYPKDLNELIPRYLPCIPQIAIHNTYGNNIKYIKNANYDRNYSLAVDEKTQYLYFSDPQSIYFGLFLINSNKKSVDDVPYFKY